MLNFCLFFLFLSSFSVLNSNQPPEHGLFLGSFAQNELLAKSENKPKVTLLKEKSTNGMVSNVFYIRDISDFLFLATKKSLPLIINVYSHKNIYQKQMHSLSDKLQGRANFISIDSSKNQQLLDLINLFISFDGLSKISQPFILFCKSKSMILEKGLVHFKKDSLKLLADNGLFDLDIVYNKIINFLN